MIFTNNKKRIESSREVLLNNRLGKDIQKMLYPVNLMLSLFLSSKYTIKDDYITPKGKKFYSATFCCVLLVYGLGINNVFFGDVEDEMGTYDRDLINIIFGFFYVFYCIGFTIIFALNIIHSDSRISLILTLQKIFTSLDFSRWIGVITIWNWFAMCSAIGVNVFMYFMYYVIYHALSSVEIVFDIMFITFDINLVYAILIIIWLRKFLEKWIEDVQKNDDGDEEFYSSYFLVYRNILDAYNLYRINFQLLVLFHTADTFFRGLCYFAILLQVLIMPDSQDYELQYTALKIVVAVWQIKDILLVITQSIQCEKFYITVEDAETACIQRLKNRGYLDAEETLCSNVIQANRTSYSKMSACGLFYIDATLPLDLMGILTNYFVIMLQAYFL